MPDSPVVTITLDDYHRWLGELFVQVRERDKALAQLSTPLPETPPSVEPS